MPEPTQTMRVVHVITGLKQGGAEAMLEKLIHTSLQCTPDWEHVVVSLGPLGTVGERLRTAGVEVHALDIRGLRTLLAGAVRVWRVLRRPGRQSLMQTWLYHADVFGGVLGKFARRPVIWNLRQTLPSLPEIKPTTRAVIRLGAKLSSWLPDAVVCCANSVAHSHVRVGYAARRCVLVDNGFDIDRMRHDSSGRAALRAHWGIADQELLIGTVGRVDPLKDHDTFLRAIEIVTRRVPAARAVLVGREVDTDSSLRSFIAAAGMESKVRLVGERRDVAAVMSALDVFVLSSKSEGFPNVLGEAMACEVPCVSTDAGDARRVLAQDEFVAPVGDPAALAERIEAMCAVTPAARGELGARLRARIAEHFTIELAWERYRQLYLGLPGVRLARAPGAGFA